MHEQVHGAKDDDDKENTDDDAAAAEGGKARRKENFNSLISSNSENAQAGQSWQKQSEREEESILDQSGKASLIVFTFV